METNANNTLRRGFSLVEFIGVLAVLTILAAVLVPVVIKRVDEAAWTKERADLAAISNALTMQIIRNKTIPNETTWAQMVADWSMVPATNITITPRRFSRVFLIDPTLQIAGAALPYTQTPSGSPACPTNARLMIISSLARTNPPVVSGRASSYAAFMDIWNTPLRSKPNNATWAGWPGTGDDLLIQRINLQPLFYQLILVNKDTNTSATFTIDAYTNNPTVVPPNYGWGCNSYYLDGTVLGLDSNSVPQLTYVLKRNMSFVFENGSWGPQIFKGPPPDTDLAVNFSATAVNFLNSILNQGALSHGNQQVDQSAALGSMLNFMLSWTMWANDNPHFNRYGVAENQVKNKLQIWNLLDIEGIGAQNSDGGNVRYFTSPGSGLLQCQ